MRKNRIMPSISILLTLIFSNGIVSAGWLDSVQNLWGKAVDTYDENWDILPGSITICVATELKDWINQSIVPKFAKKAPRVSVVIKAHGSGELTDAMNQGNSMGCDILIPGSDVAGQRWNGFAGTEKQSVASPCG
ncbi:hypothetical protein TI04_13410 [Achromatium sp. WMS2]|nr:hypothetical protein TI04_13410 [Achromatium sp. WMS2]